MSEKIVVQCDWNGGDCLNEYDAFSMVPNESKRERLLIEMGWAVVDGMHYCPEHNQVGTLKDE